MSGKYTIYEERVASLEKEKQLRKLEPITPIDGAHTLVDDEKLLSFCSYDYLGIRDHPATKQRAIQYLLQHGVTVSAKSEDGALACQKNVEEKLSATLKRETAKLYPSRFEANTTLLASLGHEAATIFYDEASHSSLIQGAHESSAAHYSYAHNSIDALEKLLKQTKSSTKIIATESIFSCSGEVTPLPALISLAKRHDALLVIDDSHALGVTGPDGVGLSANLKGIDIITGSLSKACGASGGFIACTNTLSDYLISLSPNSRALPPPILGAIDAALDLLPELEGERKQLEQRSHWLRSRLQELGFPLSETKSPLTSLPFEAPEAFHSFRDFLKKEKILVGVPSLAPTNALRLNIALNACHRPDHLAYLTDTIQTWQK